MQHIICFHLLNDYSGSPKVLKTVIKGLLDEGFVVDMYTSDGGVLDELLPHKNLKKVSCYYNFSTYRSLTILRYLWVQAITFIMAFRYLFDRDAVFYINTVLPGGPALAGWFMRKQVVYHCHEFVQKKGLVYKSLGRMMQIIATKIICVSDYQRQMIKRKKGVVVISNALPAEFANQLSSTSTIQQDKKTILMLSSLKTYKGVMEFTQLANLLPQYNFQLVLNDTEEHISTFFEKNKLNVPNNISISPKQKDVSSFYNCSSLVVNLSNKDLFVETSGMTAIEAMMAGLPIIVPTVGGISEMVVDGVNGYKIDVQNIETISQKIDLLLSDINVYKSMHNNALKASKKFSTQCMIHSVLDVIKQ